MRSGLRRRRREGAAESAVVGAYVLSWARPDCVAGVGGLELRNVVANYPFERSHRFPGILHSMLQPREDRCNLILELQTPLLEPCENLVGGRLFPRLDAIDISVDFVVALRESPELIIGSYHPLHKRDLLRKLIS